MSKTHPHDTRDRVLESACRVFAEKGYYHATLAEICERASANIAAANYYFRSKENLYAEAWRLAFKRSFDAHPPHGGVSPDAPPHQRLRGHILATARRIADPDAREFDIVLKERANPTGLLAEIMRKSIEPVRQHLAAIVSELLGPEASKQDVALCGRSIMAQCLHIFLHERPRPKAFGPPPINLGTEALAEHIFRFSLAGIRDLRDRLERSEEPEARGVNP